MKTVEKYKYLIPTWALSAIVNDDYSGIQDFDTDVQLVKNFIKSLERIKEALGADSWVFSIDTYENEYKNLAEDLMEEMQIEFLGDDEEYSSAQHWTGLIERLCTMKSLRNTDKPEFFSSEPEFGLPCNVQSCTVSYLFE